MAAFRSRQDAFYSCKLFCSSKYSCLFNRSCFHQTLVVQFRQGCTHTVIPQTTCMVRSWHESTTQCIHLLQRANLTSITEIICINATSQTRTRCRFNCNKTIICFTTQLFTHKRRNQTAQVRAATSTANDNIRMNAVLIHCCFGFQSNDRLMQQYLRQYRTQHIAITFLCSRCFYCF